MPSREKAQRKYSNYISKFLSWDFLLGCKRFFKIDSNVPYIHTHIYIFKIFWAHNDNLTFSLFFFFFLFKATPVAYGSSQARGWIRTAAAALSHCHSNAGPELLSATYTAACSNGGSLTHWARPGWNPYPQGHYIGFLTR